MHRIVLDPGHGGAEPAGKSTPFGVRGPGGTLEKDLTLAIARQVATRLGSQAVLTRTDVPVHWSQSGSPPDLPVASGIDSQIRS